MVGYVSFPQVGKALQGLSRIFPLVAMVVTGCGPAPDQSRTADLPIMRESAGANRTGSIREQQLEFLHRIRASDPQYQTIERAVINEQNELGVVLNRNIEMSDVPRLMRSMLAQMAKEFPGQDLLILAYAPANPPLKLGVGRLDAQSRQMTFTWSVSNPNNSSRLNTMQTFK